MLDRRESSRLAMKAKVRATVVPEVGKAPAATPGSFRGWTQDVSFGGLRMTSRKPPPLNSMIDMELECTRPIEQCALRGQVGWLCRSGSAYLIGIFIREPEKERLVTWRRILTRRGLLE